MNNRWFAHVIFGALLCALSLDSPAQNSSDNKEWQSIPQAQSLFQKKGAPLPKITPPPETPGYTPSPSMKPFKGKLPTPTPIDATPPSAGATALARPTPLPPLSKRYPPAEVVVAEIGEYYILTLKELEAMVPVTVSPMLLKRAETDKSVNIEIERQKIEASEETLRNWVIQKTLAAVAMKKGYKVTDEETLAKIKQLEAAQGTATEVSNQMAAVGVSQEKLIQEMHDALLVDKYIKDLVKQRFAEKDLARIYAKSPSLFMQPARVHAWQIYKEVPLEFTEKELSGLRDEFYKVRKKAMKNDGKDFEKIALETNPMIGPHRSNGDLGWVDERSILHPDLKETILNLKVKEISQIIHAKGVEPTMPTRGGVSGGPRIQEKTAGSLHILRVSEREEAKGTTFDAFAREQVILGLIQEYKQTMGPEEVRQASFKVRYSPLGLRHLEPGTTR